MPDFSVAYTINGTSTSTTVTADTFHVDDNGFLVFCMEYVGGSIQRRHGDAVAAFREWDTVRPAVTPTEIQADDRRDALLQEYSGQGDVDGPHFEGLVSSAGLKAGHAWASKLTPPSVTVSEVRVSLDNEKIRDVISRVVDEKFSKVAREIGNQRG